MFNMYQATAHSVNTYFAQLAMDVGIERGIEAARRWGSAPPRGATTATTGRPRRSLERARRSRHGQRLRGAGQQRRALPPGFLDRQDQRADQEAVRAQARLRPGHRAQDRQHGHGHAPWGGDRRHRRPRPPCRPPGGRQDRHRPGYQSAFFNGFTPQLATSVWVGFTPKPVPDAHPERRPAGLRGHVPGADLPRLHGGRPCRRHRARFLGVAGWMRYGPPTMGGSGGPRCIRTLVMLAATLVSLSAGALVAPVAGTPANHVTPSLVQLWDRAGCPAAGWSGAAATGRGPWTASPAGAAVEPAGGPGAGWRLVGADAAVGGGGWSGAAVAAQLAGAAASSRASAPCRLTGLQRPVLTVAGCCS